MICRYRGAISVRDYGEASEVLFLDGPDGPVYLDEPLAGIISEDLDQHGRHVSVRYWTADAPLEDGQLADEDLRVGGHDLLAELKSQPGRYCLLEISHEKVRDGRSSGS